MPNPVAHFAIHADDVERARSFYTQAFGWSIEPWGPPGFYMIATEAGGIHGSLQQRAEPLEGTGMRGFECSISVEDLAGSAAAIEAAGGELLTPEIGIPTVGRLRQFRDTEANLATVIQYE